MTVCPVTGFKAHLNCVHRGWWFFILLSVMDPVVAGLQLSGLTSNLSL